MMILWALHNACSLSLSLSLSLSFYLYIYIYIICISLSLSVFVAPSYVWYSVHVSHLPALTLENLAGDFYVPGTNLGKGQGGKWPEIMEAWLLQTVTCCGDSDSLSLLSEIQTWKL